MTAVGQYADQKDHHPEWKSLDGGCSVEVRLTSHFMGNQLSLADFELAQHMNVVYSSKGAAMNKLLNNPNLYLALAAAGAGYFIWSQQPAKTYPEPVLSNLVAPPELKVSDIKDVDSFVEANLNQQSLAAT